MKKNQTFKTRLAIGTIIILAIIIGILLYNMYNTKQESETNANTSYDMAFYQLLDYVQNVENFLAKSTIPTGSAVSAVINMVPSCKVLCLTVTLDLPAYCLSISTTKPFFFHSEALCAEARAEFIHPYTV